MSITLNYHPGPTAARFHQNDHFVRLLMGPVGCGKSVSCCMEILHRAIRQARAPDGLRYSRWVVIRNTYPELRTTTVQTWEACVNGRAFGNTGSDWFLPLVYSSPIKHQLTFDDVVLELWFLSMDKPKDVKKLLSLETTGVWLNEVRELPKAVLDAATQRCGRYPAQQQGGASWFGVIMDTNPPSQDHWLYRLFECDKPSGFTLFRYPPALLTAGKDYQLNPDAENTAHLHPDYYLNQAKGKSREWIKVYLQGDYGSDQDGKPVYPEYADQVHCIKDLKPLEGIPLLLGWDFGLTPACVIVQLSPKGQLLILDELQAVKTGIQDFAQHQVRAFLARHYANFGFMRGQADPAGLAGSQAHHELTCIGVLNDKGFDTEAALTNQFEPRRNAVAYFLTQLIDGEPALCLSDRCHSLRQGFLGRYAFTRVQVMGTERYRDRPVKNHYSHLQDALQYVCLKAQHQSRADDTYSELLASSVKRHPDFFAA